MPVVWGGWGVFRRVSAHSSLHDCYHHVQRCFKLQDALATCKMLTRPLNVKPLVYACTEDWCVHTKRLCLCTNHVCIYIYTHFCVCINTCMFKYTGVVCMCFHMFRICLHLHTDAAAHTRVCMYIYIYMYASCELPSMVACHRPPVRR